MLLGLFLLLLQTPKTTLIRGRVTAVDGVTPVRYAIVKFRGMPTIFVSSLVCGGLYGSSSCCPIESGPQDAPALPPVVMSANTCT